MSLALRLQLLLAVACLTTGRTEAVLAATAALALIATRGLVRRHVPASAPHLAAPGGAWSRGVGFGPAPRAMPVARPGFRIVPRGHPGA
jgi:hypothetical protein